MPRRLATIIIVLFVSGVATAAEPTVKVLRGKVVPVVRVQAKPGDAPAVALVTDDTLLPLANTPVSRLLFADPAMQKREVELTVKELPGSPFVEVTLVRTIVEGKRHEVYYYCYECQLRAEEPGACKCCGRDTVLVETPIPAK